MFGAASDETLIRRALAGSERAWLQLVKRHQRRVYNHALRMSGNRDDALDIMQEVFMSVYRNLDTFRGDSRFSTWLFRIAASRCTDYFRRQHLFGEVCLDAGDLADGESGGPLEALGQLRDNEGVLALMRSLPPEQRLVVELKFFGHFTFDEISEQLGISTNTAKTRLYAAIKKMRRAHPLSLNALEEDNGKAMPVLP